MRRDKFNFSGILTFLVLGVAVCVLGAHVFGAVGVDGASCDTEGIWSVGVRPMGGPVTTEDELRAIIDWGESYITFGANIALTSYLLISQDVTIDGGGYSLTYTQGVSSSGVITVSYPKGLVTIKNMTIIGGSSYGIDFYGDGSMDIVNCTITGNATTGIVFYSRASNAMNVIDSTIANNKGVGIEVESWHNSGGHLSVRNSTIASNDGGGIEVAVNSMDYRANMDVYACTIENNGASGGGSPGIVFNGGKLLVQYSTIANNNGHGISINAGATSAQIMNSTIVGNTNSDNAAAGVSTASAVDIMFCTITGNNYGTYSDGGSVKIASSISVGNGTEWKVDNGSWTSANYNVFGDSSGGGTDAYNVTYAQAFGTNTLADNGGKTRTIKPIDGSPAINRVPANAAFFGWTFDRDQRSDPATYPRPGKGKTMKDSGAFETQVGGGATELLSTYKLDLVPGGTGSITARAEGTWATSDSSVASIDSAPFAPSGVLLGGVSGKTVYVKAGGLGRAVITFTSGNGTASVDVFVSPKSIVDMNDVLSADGVGVNILSPDLFPSADARVDKTAPTLLCYAPSDKPAGIVEVDISGHADPSNVFLPMQYTLALSKGEIDAKCAEVGRSPIANLFDKDIPDDGVLNAFFSVFVIQKEIMQGQQKGQLARLLGEVVAPREARSAGILAMNADAEAQKVHITFRYMVKDGTGGPEFDAENKWIVIGDGLADRLIVDPLWTSVRKASGSVTPPDGGGGCNAGFLPMLMVFVLLTGVCYNEKEHRPE